MVCGFKQYTTKLNLSSPNFSEERNPRRMLVWEFPNLPKAAKVREFKCIFIKLSRAKNQLATRKNNFIFLENIIYPNVSQNK